MNKKDKIFVAGHRGLVGSALVKKLFEEGYTNLVTRTRNELDLRNQKDVFDFFDKEKPNYVFLSAAKVGGIGWNKNCPAEFTYDNLQIQNNIIHSSYLTGVKKLLFLGSACIYPKITPQPIKEEYLMTDELEPTNEGYALSKIVGLKMCQYYNRQYGFNAISLMPANLYGINDNFNIEKCHVIPAMIRKFINAKENNEKSVVCFGDGTPTREFLYSDDLADACLFLMKNYDSPDIINVGSSIDVTIKELAETIKNKIGFTGDIVWDTTKPNGTPLRKLCNKKINSLGWVSKTVLGDGISKTIDWYMANKKNYYRN
jgi:GDP-L-fucose synthase